MKRLFWSAGEEKALQKNLRVIISAPRLPRSAKGICPMFRRGRPIHRIPVRRNRPRMLPLLRFIQGNKGLLLSVVNSLYNRI